MRPKLWYRCQMCSPDRSIDFDVDTVDIPLNNAYQLVFDHHKLNSPTCPCSSPRIGQTAVEILLIRMIQ